MGGFVSQRGPIVKKIGHIFNLFCSKMGESAFPIFEPILQLIENKNPEVRKYFKQAFINLNQRKQSFALLNLNMVLNLKPNHFLARVFRGRIYVKEGQYRLASKDYLEANRISQYRFTHYDLYQEYFKAVNSEFRENDGIIVQKFDDVFDTIDFISNKKGLKFEIIHEFEHNWPAIETGGVLPQDSVLTLEDLTSEEKGKFQTLGPISQKEIEENDWDLLMDDLKS